MCDKCINKICIKFNKTNTYKCPICRERYNMTITQTGLYNFEKLIDHKVSEYHSLYDDDDMSQHAVRNDTYEIYLTRLENFNRNNIIIGVNGSIGYNPFSSITN